MNTDFLRTALTLAEHAIGLSSPNPRVGCVLVRDSQIIGQGFTQAAGQAHAEVMAIRDAQAHKHDTTGATAYVTLEPCSHHGRTPPCVEALIQARVARVVVACLDPNPQVAGQGVTNLRNAGIVVEVLPAEHPIAQAAYELNIGFMNRMTHGKVFTRMKWAQSADGKTALSDGRSQWITGEAARMDGASLWGEIVYVLTPMAVPGIASTMLLNIILAWNEAFWTIRLTTTNAAPLTAFIASFSSPQGLFWAKLSAASTLAIAPILIMGWFSQKQLVRGLTFGAVK